MKIVPNYSNSSLNNACLQACVKGVLDYFNLSDFLADVDLETGYHEDSYSWIPQTTVWLSSLGFDVCFYSPFDYEGLVTEGIEFMKKFKGQFFDLEYQRGDYKYLDDITKATRKMSESRLWKKEVIDTDYLAKELSQNSTLAIGKTVHEWMAERYIAGTTHFVTMIKEYSPEKWLINDPGLPPVERRKVNKTINNHGLIGEVLLIKSKTNIEE